MTNLASSIVVGIITGLMSSTLVVIFFEYRQNKKHKLSHAHILHRFINELFGILTIIRVSSDLPHPKENKVTDVLAELEQILGRRDPSILFRRLINLTVDQHKYIYNQLTRSQQALAVLFSDSIAHKTIDGKVSASIAETQAWIDAVLIYYNIFPEILNGQADQMMMTRWMPSIPNLAENSFAILSNMLALKNISDEMLRWGTRA